jgi:hypothetical protein
MVDRTKGFYAFVGAVAATIQCGVVGHDGVGQQPLDKLT